jgi:hypothetical protein
MNEAKMVDDIPYTSNSNLTFNSSSQVQPQQKSPARPHNINIVMMGDSLMRYQYLSLVYFLRWGQWFDPNITHVDNLMVESTWAGHTISAPFNDKHNNNTNNITGSWNTFLYHSNRLLLPYEICDCYRERKAINVDANILENRYYYDPIYNNTVIYIQAFGHHTKIHGRIRHPSDIIGNNRRTALWDDYQRRLVGTWASPYEWEYTEWHDVIRYYLAPLQPDFIVLNSGWWGSKFDIIDDKNSASFLLKEAFAELMSNHSNTRGIWRTTTYPPWPNNKKRWGSNASAVDQYMCQAPSMGCLNVSWTRHVPRQFSKDGIHFLEPVYRVMNEAMLEQMGYHYVTTDSKTTALNHDTTATLGAELRCFKALLSVKT